MRPLDALPAFTRAHSLAPEAPRAARTPPDLQKHPHRGLSSQSCEFGLRGNKQTTLALFFTHFVDVAYWSFAAHRLARKLQRWNQPPRDKRNTLTCLFKLGEVRLFIVFHCLWRGVDGPPVINWWLFAAGCGRGQPPLTWQTPPRYYGIVCGFVGLSSLNFVILQSLHFLI